MLPISPHQYLSYHLPRVPPVTTKVMAVSLAILFGIKLYHALSRTYEPLNFNAVHSFFP